MRDTARATLDELDNQIEKAVQEELAAVEAEERALFDESQWEEQEKAAADAEALVSLSDRPEFFSQIFSLEQWAAMSVAERSWMRQVFLTPRQPITMMEPFNIDW